MFQPDTLRHLLDEVKPEAAPYTLESLEAWLETKATDEIYCWSGVCLFELYGEAFSNYISAAAYNHAVKTFRENLSISCGEPYEIGYRKPHTFGDALPRTRAAIAARSAQ